MVVAMVMIVVVGMVMVTEMVKLCCERNDAGNNHGGEIMMAIGSYSSHHGSSILIYFNIIH